MLADMPHNTLQDPATRANAARQPHEMRSWSDAITSSVPQPTACLGQNHLQRSCRAVQTYPVEVLGRAALRQAVIELVNAVVLSPLVSIAEVLVCLLQATR